LPQPLTSFVGREAEIAAVGALPRVPHMRLVTLTGPGGAGKTRLAIRAAEELTDLFTTPCFVSLAAIRDPDLVIPTIAQARLRETVPEVKFGLTRYALDCDTWLGSVEHQRPRA
jgi:predicted ATPase